VTAIGMVCILISMAIAYYYESLYNWTPIPTPKQDSCYGYKGKCNRVMSDGNPCGLNAPCPDCGLSLIDCPQPQPWEKFCDSNCVWTDHHPDCKLAEQKPCCYGGIAHDCHAGDGCRIAERLKATTPPQRKPLTDEQAMDAYFETPPFGTYKEAFIAGIRFIEAAHGIKGEA